MPDTLVPIRIPPSPTVPHFPYSQPTNIPVSPNGNPWGIPNHPEVPRSPKGLKWTRFKDWLKTSPKNVGFTVVFTAIGSYIISTIAQLQKQELEDTATRHVLEQTQEQKDQQDDDSLIDNSGDCPFSGCKKADDVWGDLEEIALQHLRKAGPLFSDLSPASFNAVYLWAGTMHFLFNSIETIILHSGAMRCPKPNAKECRKTVIKRVEVCLVKVPFGTPTAESEGVDAVSR